MDESYLTGEPFLIEKAPGSTVLSGAINGNVALTIRATKIASDSRYAKIVEVLHASEENRPQIQRLGDRLGSWYTPIAITIALASWLFSGHSERFLAVLVIATPCPLLISIPVAIIGAISVGAKLGVLLGLVSVRYVESLLYGVKGTDVSMLVMPCAMLLGAALLASLPAVLRAVRIDPAVMLRAE
jgi:cation transport ATPase